jgi:hypothetical protein
MTSLRYDSYRRVLAVLDELEDAELEGDEREFLRDAAEGLLLIRAGEEHERDKILLDAWLVLSSLVRTGRWRYRAAEQMRRMLEACGPERIQVRVAALV